MITHSLVLIESSEQLPAGTRSVRSVARKSLILKLLVTLGTRQDSSQLAAIIVPLSMTQSTDPLPPSAG